jgi:hypothetical protein
MVDNEHPNLRLSLTRAVDKHLDEAVGTVLNGAADVVRYLLHGLVAIGLIALAHVVSGFDWLSLTLGGSGLAGIGLFIRNALGGAPEPHQVAGEIERVAKSAR